MIKRYILALMSMAILIGVISISPVSAQTSSATYTINFEGLAEGAIISEVSCGAGINCNGNPNVTVFVDGRNSILANANLNTAMIFDAECVGGCSGQDFDLNFPGHGKTLINSEDLDSSDPDDADVSGSFFEFDFFGLPGTVTIDSIDVGDVEQIEADAFINFHDGSCAELDQTETIVDIPTIGDNQIATLQIGAVGGVGDAHCVQVRLNGSGTIDNIKFTVVDTPGTPAIDIEKLTNGAQADGANDADVPQIAAGQTVNWAYTVTNTGTVALTNIVVTDDQGVAVTCPHNTLGVGQSMTCTGSGTAIDLSGASTGVTIVDGCGSTPPRNTYENMGLVTANPPTGAPVTDEDLSHYCNPPGTPGIHIEKATNGQDADNPASAPPTVPEVAPDGSITWRYTVTNTGDVPLANVFVNDDNGTPAVNDDFSPTFVSGDANNNNLLDFLPDGTSETWIFEATGAALDLSDPQDTAGVTIMPGCGSPPRNTYENTGRVTAVTNDTAATTVEDADLSHYCNPPEQPEPLIHIEKWTKIAVAPATGDDVCETIGKPQFLTMRYTGGNAEIHSQDPGKVSVISFTDDPLAAPQVHIIAAKNSDGGGSRFFDSTVDGTVSLGQDFVIDGSQSKLGSSTYILIFDAPNGTLLQKILFHTSCSQPLNLGDQYGAAQLISITDKDGNDTGDFDPGTTSDFGEDADTPTGPSGQAGDEVVWTYFVTNPGTVPLSNVVVTDNIIGLVTQLVAKENDNNDNFLDPGERWIYQASGTVASGQYANIGEACGVGAGQNVCDDDPSHHIGVAPAGDACDDGKPGTLTMLYTGDNVLDGHSQASGKVKISGDPEFADVVHIISADKSDGTGRIFFDGTVNLGETFVIDGSQRDLKGTTYVLILDQDNNVLQRIEFHTSCSQPLELGDQYGGIQLVGFTAR